jgi:hypothetical protein
LASNWRPNYIELSLAFSVNVACKPLIFLAWGARGPGFKSRRPDQLSPFSFSDFQFPLSFVQTSANLRYASRLFLERDFDHFGFLGALHRRLALLGGS